MNYYNIILQSLFAFATLFIISKILGKKQVAQLEFSDYVVGISIGSIAANMATETELPIYTFIIAMALFGGLDLFLTLIARKSKSLKLFIKGRPLIIIEDGKMNFKNIVKSKLDINEIIAQCRNKGYFFIDDIAYCIFEISGDFSILPKSNTRPIVAEDLNIKEKPAEMQKEIIIDGKIRESELEKINKTKEWALKKLKIKNKSELKNIFLATYDDETDKLLVHYKNQNKK
ncbi:MAG: DUF421 domain-containing protein [Clostridia bacterium]|nr:DUF421 domain-containing protein [Clostridia bacterium]MDD3862920.1 DUF421 domain-containing protein [Clostridia bacterium]MDD4409011.1 DUF421 domain-containing protein [Clostridia bacterium]